MGRPGRYALSVMAWVAAFAGWSSVVGLVVAAVTGDRPRSVSPGASAVLTVIVPLVPTLVALWFNDWARDGFPTGEQRRAAAARPVPQPEPGDGADAGPATDAAVEPEPEPAPEAEAVGAGAPAGFPVAPLLRDEGRF
jgi:hypothetical protein